jgi:hypothetical protein
MNDARIGRSHGPNCGTISQATSPGSRAGVVLARIKSPKQAENYFEYLDLSLTLLKGERKKPLRLREEGRITDEVLSGIEYELDLREARLTAASTINR